MFKKFVLNVKCSERVEKKKHHNIIFNNNKYFSRVFHSCTRIYTNIFWFPSARILVVFPSTSRLTR